MIDLYFKIVDNQNRKLNCRSMTYVCEFWLDYNVAMTAVENTTEKMFDKFPNMHHIISDIKKYG